MMARFSLSQCNTESLGQVHSEGETLTNFLIVDKL